MAWVTALAWACASPEVSAEPPATETQSIAFYYGDQVPVAELSHFKQVVLEPGATTPEELKALRANSQVYAYLSVGEVNRNNAAHAQVQPDWIISENAAWGSDVVDPRHAQVRAFLLAQAQALWARGYHGLFLDTLDSPLAVPAPPSVVQARTRALVELLREMHQRLPGVKLLLNRGFELFPEAAPFAAGVVAESLFTGWNAAANRYEPVAEKDRAWLQERLTHLHERHGLPVTVIDYLPPSEREQARTVARSILALGFTPYVTNASLDTLGVGPLEVVPRRVLALYDGAEGAAVQSTLHRLLALPLESLGYTLDYRDVRGELPTMRLAGRYAGVVAWVSGPPLEKPKALRAWLDRQCDDGVRAALFGELGFIQEPGFLARRGLAPVKLEGPVHMGRADALIGFEAPPAPHARSLPILQAASASVRVHLSVRDESNREAAAILSGACGGVAQSPYVLEEGFEGQQRWVLDPFTFLPQALGLEPIPAPDATTENGRRLLVIDIDGEGFGAPAEVLGTPAVGQVLLESLLARHPLPVSMRLPKGALEAPGLRPLARKAARRIHIEEPGHGAPHPAEALLPATPLSLTALSPLMRLEPVKHSREAARTLSPFAYSRLTEVLAWTDHPRRLSPLMISHPVGACTTPAGVRALAKVYSWAQAQPTLPLWRCEYEDRARGFAQATLARTFDGTWQIRGLGALRTLRLPTGWGEPALERSQGVAGFADTPQGRYVSLAAPEAQFVLSETPSAGPRLVWANAPLLDWKQEASTVEVHLRGHLPVALALTGVAQGCRFTGATGTVPGVLADGVTRFHFPTADTGHARLVCF
ncbi:putative signal peptide protein [Stigmatella aurantiaca DW4/3-1]|uniref:Putative signal peptide protein n=1 Tax=Stigmatella aurantiaca (strain DW4/3-1) TaxID=378806 RepID=Q098C4_STIAD|nr:putative signal peptide protein [Stigmatella aurantiaca DW4/3-1]